MSSQKIAYYWKKKGSTYGTHDLHLNIALFLEELTTYIFV